MNGSSPIPVYGEFAPSAQLREFVENVWVQECDPTPDAPPTTVVPTGRVELIFHYCDPYRQLNNDNCGVMPRCHVVGQQKAPIILNALGTTGIVIVRFKPWGAFSIFGDALADINDQIVDLELLWNKCRLDDLLEQLAAAANQSARAELADAFVASHLLPQDSDRLSVASVNAINANWGRDRIDEVARHFELGRRQFNRRFTRRIGASPKQLSRVLRAQKAIASIRAGGNVHDIVDRCGYVDQSHLIHDVVSHSNRRPTALAELPSSAAHRYFNSSDIAAFCGTTYL